MPNIIPYFILALQIIAALLGFLYLKKVKSTFALFLAMVLGLTATVEVFGLYLLKTKQSSHILYLCYIFLNFNLIGLLYNSIIKQKINYGFLVLGLLFNLSFFLFPLKQSFFTFMIIGSINTSIYCFLYLRQLLVSDDIISYKKLLPFWVSVGFLVFYLPSIPFFYLFNEMRNREFFFITKVLAVIMNLFLIYGLLCSSKEEKY